MCFANEGIYSSTIIAPSNDCKRVFNEVPLTPWCHVVVRFLVTMSCFPASFWHICLQK